MIFPAVNLQSEMGISHGQGFFFQMVFETNQIQSFISIYGCIQILLPVTRIRFFCVRVSSEPRKIPYPILFYWSIGILMRMIVAEQHTLFSIT